MQSRVAHGAKTHTAVAYGRVQGGLSEVVSPAVLTPVFPAGCLHTERLLENERLVNGRRRKYTLALGFANRHATEGVSWHGHNRRKVE
jgi:hypothetical protein